SEGSEGVEEATAGPRGSSSALATVCVSPGLLPLDVLARLDRWWLASELPTYQLAFAHHARRALAFLLRGALLVLAATFIVGASGHGWGRSVRRRRRLPVEATAAGDLLQDHFVGVPLVGRAVVGQRRPARANPDELAAEERHEARKPAADTGRPAHELGARDGPVEAQEEVVEAKRPPAPRLREDREER